jgi:hypothetical protein
MFSNIFKPNLSSKFSCDVCDYNTSKKSNYNNHILSAKHSKAMIINNFKPTLSSGFICQICSKEYKDNSGLWRHKKKCCIIQPKIVPTVDDLSLHDNQQQLVDYLMKENSEFKQLMIDQNKQMLELAKNAGNNNTKYYNL